MAAKLETQLDRIDTIQSRIEQVLLDDSLQEIEDMTAEMGSRLATVLTSLAGQEAPPGIRHRLSQVLERDLSLADLVQRKLTVLRTELAKAHAAGSAAKRYVIDPRKAEALSVRSTDLKG